MVRGGVTVRGEVATSAGPSRNSCFAQSTNALTLAGRNAREGYSSQAALRRLYSNALDSIDQLG